MKEFLNELARLWWIEVGTELHKNPLSEKSLNGLRTILKEEYDFDEIVVDYVIELTSKSLSNESTVKTPTNFHLGGDRTSGMVVGKNDTAVSAHLNSDEEESVDENEEEKENDEKDDKQSEKGTPSGDDKEKAIKDLEQSALTAKEKEKLKKEDVYVKNKKSGSVYTVKKANPQNHTAPSKGEIEKAKKDDGNKGDSEKQSDKSTDDKKVNIKNEKMKQEFISKTVDALLEQIGQERGAGAYGVEKEDLESLKSFAEGKGPKVPNYEISDKDLEYAYSEIEKKTKDMSEASLGKIRSMLQNKGAADPDSVRVGTPDNPGPGFGRRDKVLKSFLACGGISAVTGRPVSIGSSNVDHRVSLENGGKDEPDNWIWMETNLNMMKSSLSDNELIERVEKELAKSPEEVKEKKRKQMVTKLTKAAYKKHFSEVFSKGGNGGITEKDLDGMTVSQMKNIIRGWNDVYPKSSDDYVNTYKAQVGGSRGGGRGVALSKGDLKKNFLEQLNKKEKVLTNEEIDVMDEVLTSTIDKISK